MAYRVAQLVQALEHIRDDLGGVCPEFPICSHQSCGESYSALSAASAALEGDFANYWTDYTRPADATGPYAYQQDTGDLT